MALLLNPPLQRPSRGFTIVELVITVLVMAVLVALALPSFTDSIRKGRRSEALSALSAIQQAQERYRGNQRNYGGTLADIGITLATTKPGGYYALATGVVAATDATRYVVTADGSGGSQAQDAQCAKLSVEVDGGTIRYASCKSCSVFTYQATDPCWSR